MKRSPNNTFVPDVPGRPLADFCRHGSDGVEVNHAMLPTLKRADVIFGRDVVTRNEFLVFGRDMLQRIAKGKAGKAGKRAGILVIELNQATDELEMLGAMLLVHKGKCDYKASPDWTPPPGMSQN